MPRVKRSFPNKNDSELKVKLEDYTENTQHIRLNKKITSTNPSVLGCRFNLILDKKNLNYIKVKHGTTNVVLLSLEE